MDAAVALLGLGNMGTPIAERLLDAGYALAVWNRTTDKANALVERGAKQLRAPAEALREADVCVTVLADDAAFEDVVLGEHGVLSGARPGTTLIDMSTISVDASEHVAGRAAQAGVGYLRAPVSGSPVIVRGGTLTIMVSGPEDLADDLRPLLEAIGPTVLYVGHDEAARVVKLVLQVLIGGTAELLAEALVLGEMGGVDREKLLEVIGASVVGSRFVEYKTKPLLEEDYSATFTTNLMLKDVGLVLDLASERGIDLPFTERMSDLLADAVARGHGDSDFIALFRRLQEQEARVKEPTATRDR
jgi:3-hydroxyisobutyrate dehydrogenase-like beta-hydroxyacid dehydrogenase